MVFKAGSSTGDYHKEMNFEKFKNWLVPNLKPNSVVILDNVAYHNVQLDKCLTSANRKEEIKDYPQRHNIPFGDQMYKAELWDMYNKHKQDPVYLRNEFYFFRSSLRYDRNGPRAK